MSTMRYSLAYICPKDLAWSPDLRHTAVFACPQHETDRQGRGLIASLPTHATENRL